MVGCDTGMILKGTLYSHKHARKDDSDDRGGAAVDSYFGDVTPYQHGITGTLASGSHVIYAK